VKPTCICLLALCAFAVSQYVRAEEAGSSQLRWVIIATVIDKTSRRSIAQMELGSGELTFESSAECNLILRKIHPFSDEHLAVILKCSKIAAPEEHL
jgi:hypothetical protein